MPCLVPKTSRAVLHDVGHRAQYYPLSGLCRRCHQSGHVARECRETWGPVHVDDPENASMQRLLCRKTKMWRKQLPLPLLANVADPVPVSPVAAAASVPTVPISDVEHTVEPGTAPLAFKDDPELQAHARNLLPGLWIK